VRGFCCLAQTGQALGAPGSRPFLYRLAVEHIWPIDKVNPSILTNVTPLPKKSPVVPT
jgi:hypothetical protein